jgi:hypothetical protein
MQVKKLLILGLIFSSISSPVFADTEESYSEKACINS